MLEVAVRILGGGAEAEDLAKVLGADGELSGRLFGCRAAGNGKIKYRQIGGIHRQTAAGHGESRGTLDVGFKREGVGEAAPQV